MPRYLVALNLILSPIISFAQCVGGGFWFNTIPGGSLMASGAISVIDTVTFRTSLPTFGGFNAGRPGYLTGAGSWSSYTYQSMGIFRGGGIGAATKISLKVPADSNNIHVRISDIRGDGINTEAQRVEGFLNGVPVSVTFKDFVNGPTVSGNVVNGASTTTAATQSAIRAFFNGPVDSISITSTGFSDFVIIELAARCDLILPQRSARLTAEAGLHQVRLDWSAENITFAQAVLERSNDQVKWTRLNVSFKSTSYVDIRPNEGLNFYRIRWIDKDGSVQAQAITKVRFTGEHVSIFPNPVLQVLHVQFSGYLQSFSIYNSTGAMLVARRNLLMKSWEEDCRSLPAGAYVILAVTSDGSPLQTKFIKL